MVACPSSESVTRSVTAIELPPEMRYIKTKKIYLIDTPGFKDTEGSIMDLSNTFGTASAIKSLESAKFVILLSGKDEGSRYQGLVEIMEILNELFPNYEKVSDSIMLLLNRYTLK